jgi:hypothetical protein
MVTRLRKKVKPIKESKLDSLSATYEMINSIRSLTTMQELSYRIDKDTLDPQVRKIYEAMLPCLEAECYLNEAISFPLQFDKEGNLFIKNIKKRDYEAEYAKSHKLLKKYEETDNIEGIKYELAKLWMMNSVIEAKIHSDNEKDLSKEHKARAKILNDFNHYLQFVLIEEPDFNFESYYNESPFSDEMVKINKHTLIWSGRILRSLLSGI